MTDTPMPDTPDLEARLRSLVRVRHEWRVQDPKDGAYCIAFSRDDGYSLDPERDARAWLADCQQRFPTSKQAGFVVACVPVQTQTDIAIQEAADALASARTQAEEMRAEIERLRADSELVDWLDQNIFHHEPDDFDRKRAPNSTQWLIWAPKGVQGSARAILGAALRSEQEAPACPPSA